MGILCNWSDLVYKMETWIIPCDSSQTIHCCLASPGQNIIWQEWVARDNFTQKRHIPNLLFLLGCQNLNEKVSDVCTKKKKEKAHFYQI